MTSNRPNQLLLAGLLLPLLGWLGFYLQVKILYETGTPWYVPATSSLGAVLAALSLGGARGRWRLTGAGLSVLSALFAWFYVLVLSSIPAYDGPYEAGQRFPDFEITRPGEEALGRDDLDGQRHVVIFYRNW